MISDAQIESLKTRLAGIETRLADPATQTNQKQYTSLLREHASLRRRVEKVDAYLVIRDGVAENRALIQGADSDPELAELAREELGALEEALPAAEKDLLMALLPEDPSDGRGAIMEIRAGTGGDEAALFAGDLYRMYTRYAENHGFKIGLIDASTSEAGGYKEVVFSVGGADVYKSLKYESGVHRVQRVPATESQGRIHTSAATVAVFAEAEDNDDVEISPDDVRVDIFCASGPGGQSVNTTYSAVRVTHLPTGLVAQSQDERSQHRNKDKAMTVLRARILDHQRREEEERMGDVRRSQIGSGDRSERTRTYNFPQNRLTEHRINLTLYSLDRIMEGELDELINTLAEQDTADRLGTELGRDLATG